MELLVDIILFSVIALMVFALLAQRRIEKRWDSADWEQLMSWAERYRGRNHPALAERCLVNAIGKAAQFPPDDPRRAESYAALGAIYVEMSDWERAESLISKALVARRRAFGEVHEQVAVDLKQLGEIWSHRGDAGEAERHYRLALSTLERDGLSESQLARDIGAAIADLAAARSDQAEAGGDGGSA